MLRIGASAIAIFILLAASFFLFQNREVESKSESDTTVVAKSDSVEVKRGQLKRTLLLGGELRAVKSRIIYSNAQDEVKIVYLAPEGSIVKTGDKIAEVDSTSIQTRIKENEEKLVAAESEIVRVQAVHEGALRDLEVELSKLWLAFEQAKVEGKKPKDVLARRDYQEKQLALDKTKTEYDNHLNKISQKKKEQAAELLSKTIERDKIKIQLDRALSSLTGMKITAPNDGMVIYGDHWMERRKLQVGDVVWGGFPICSLPDTTNMEILADVNEVDGPRLSIGNKAEVRLDSYPNSVITGTVKEIAQSAIKANRFGSAKIFKVVISLDQTLPAIMKPGMSAMAAVAVSESPNQLLVPRSSVKFDGDKVSVTRIENENGKVNKRSIAVTVIASDPLHYLIADNGVLKVKDRIAQ